MACCGGVCGGVSSGVCGGVCGGACGPGPVLRVRLCFDYPPPGLVQCTRSWVLLDRRECRVMMDVVSVIREKFRYSSSSDLELYLQDCYLPPAESALLLRDSDTLRVKVHTPDPTVRKRRRGEEEEERGGRKKKMKKNREGGSPGEPTKKHKKKKKRLVPDEEPSSSRPEKSVLEGGAEPSSEGEEPAPARESPKIKKSSKPSEERPTGTSNKVSSTVTKKPTPPKPPTEPPKSSSSSRPKPGKKTQKPSSSSSSSSDENKAPVAKRKSTIAVTSQNPPKPHPQTSSDSSSSSKGEEKSGKSARRVPKSIGRGEPTKPPTEISTTTRALKGKTRPPPTSSSDSSSSESEVPPKPSSVPLENGSAPAGENLPNPQQQNVGGASDSSDYELVIRKPHPQLVLAQTPRGRGFTKTRGGGRGFARARGTPWKPDFHHTYQHEENHQRETLSNTSVLLQNPPGPVLRRDYEALPLLAAPPAVGTKIAFKLLELTENYTPEVSDYKEGKIVGLNPTTSLIELELLTKSHTPAEPGKFDLVYQNADGSEHVEYAVTLGSRLNERWESLLEPRLILDQTTS